jgi:hypothetical protein
MSSARSAVRSEASRSEASGLLSAARRTTRVVAVAVAREPGHAPSRRGYAPSPLLALSPSSPLNVHPLRSPPLDPPGTLPRFPPPTRLTLSPH